jgi:hypothetical protein
MSYMRIEMGKNLLGCEGEVAWATPGTYTDHETYVDPSSNLVEVQRRLAKDKKNSPRNIRRG